MPKVSAFSGTNLDDICRWITNAKWVAENCDVVLFLSDSGLTFWPSLGSAELSCGWQQGCVVVNPNV
jgi:hypothetical protein